MMRLRFIRIQRLKSKKLMVITEIFMDEFFFFAQMYT